MAQLLSWLHESGARKSDGTTVASGSAYFYQAGTTSTQATVYGDADGLCPIKQPVRLDASGRATVYTKSPVKLSLLDASGVSVSALDRANTHVAAAIEVENASFTGIDLSTGALVTGGRTSFHDVFNTMGTALGLDLRYTEAAGSSSRALRDAIGESIRPQDFGALGDGSADDTTSVQRAIDHALYANKPLYFEPGTYRITSALKITAPNLLVFGAGRARSILKDMTTSIDVLTVDLGSAVESGICIRDLGITADTTSTGAGIRLTNGDGVLVKRVSVSGHRNGYDSSAVSYARFVDCLVVSTDSTSSGLGIRLGAKCTAERCRVTAATSGKGISLEGEQSVAIGTKVIASSSGTGINVTANDCTVTECFAGGATTGLNVGAVARANIVANRFGSNTTDLVINASATNTHETDNHYSTITDNANLPHGWFGRRSPYSVSATTYTGTMNQNLSTVHPTTANYIVWYATTGNSLTLTISNPLAIDYQEGTPLVFALSKASANNLTVSWDTRYTGVNLPTTVTGGTVRVVALYWDTTQQKFRFANSAASTNTL